MKRVLVAGASLLVSITVAQAAIECIAELPENRTGYWAWRTIDGRKCWYQGRQLIPRSELYWAAPTFAEAQASMLTAPAVVPAVQHAVSAAGIDPDDGSFESRWRGLDAKP